MIALTQGQTTSPSAPGGLVFIGQNQGQVVAATSLKFRILDVSNVDKENAGGTQIYPGSGLHTVDLVNDVVPFDPNNLDPTKTHQVGYYVARWTVPSNQSLGKYQIEWTYELTVPSSSVFTSITTEPPPSGVFRKNFEILKTSTQVLVGPRYAFVADVREELGCASDISDARLSRLIVLASSMIEKITGRYFDVRPAFLRYSGNSSRKLQLNPPIVGISSVGIDTQPTMQGDLVIELDLIRIYNRHLSQGMLSPDDRENPKLEFVHSDDLYGVRFVPFRGISLRSLAWPIGVQNIHVRGFYGFTEPDGSPWGDTPILLQHACKLIVARELPRLSSTDAREDAQWRWRVTDDKSKDLEVKLADPRKWGEWFGNPELDFLLAGFIRPPEMGAA